LMHEQRMVGEEIRKGGGLQQHYSRTFLETQEGRHMV
jgi:hypothetical protein